jgi:DNA-directed RNA polymerase subunit RPC12/RpoP
MRSGVAVPQKDFPKYVCQKCNRIVFLDPKKDVRCDTCGHRVLEKAAINAPVQHLAL